MNVSDLSFLTPVANHLWQSTVCAGLIWLLTLALKENRAAVRYWLWFAASVKFLFPFSFLVALGGQLSWRTAAPIVQPQWSFVVNNAIQPFAASTAPTQIVPPHASFALAPILIVVWLCGVVVGFAFWLKCWMQMRRVRKAATPLPLTLPIPALSSPSQIEPGVFGIFRPILLLPEGIESRLTSTQLDAIVAHELAHVRRRDNLTAAIHMLVEVVFWFFPVVWWLRARLIEERENACDEAVLRTGSEAESYAEGIIEVCKSYAESPAACISGISGSGLKKLVIRIVNRRLGENLTRSKKVALTLASVAVLVAPLIIGLLNAPLLHAQSPETNADWEKAAGAKMSFDAASFTQGKTGRSRSNFPKFEVASIKPHNDGGRRVWQFLSGGTFTDTGLPLERVITIAYDIPFPDTQLSGGPDWIRSDDDGYDIEAKAPEGAVKGLSVSESDEQMRRMLQGLLADRFKLIVRREMKEQPVYLLTVAKNGPKLEQSKIAQQDCNSSGECNFGGSVGQGRGIHVKGSSIADLVSSLDLFTDRPLLNKTGLTGLYDIDTGGWAPMREMAQSANPNEAAALADPNRPTLSMILDKLGLRISPSQAAVESFEIEHIERPTPN